MTRARRVPRPARMAVLLLIFAGASAPAQTIQMRAGVAKAVITNQEPLMMVNGNLSNGVARDIHARALVLNDGATRLIIITYDLNCLDVGTPILRERVQKEMGIDPSHLILLATHNHNAPIQIIPANFEYGEWLADRMFDLIQEAISNERGPVTIEFGFGPGYFITSRGNAPVDYEIQVLRVMEGEQPVAVLFNHGTHPLQASRAKIDAGHPGFAMDALEAALPGVQAMYSDASGGNQFPLRPRGFEAQVSDSSPRGRAYTDETRTKMAKALGEELAEAVLSITRGEMTDVTGPISTSMEVLALPLGDPISEAEARDLAKKFPADTGFVYYTEDDNRGTNWVRMLLRYYDKGLPFPKTTTEMIGSDDTYLIHESDSEFLEKYDYSIHDAYPNIYEEVIVARIGPMPLVAMQGEVCAPIGARIKDAFRRNGPIMVFGYMGEHNLYIPTRELVRLKAYQARVIQIQYASPVPWAPEVEDEMVGGVVRMVEAIMED